MRHEAKAEEKQYFFFLFFFFFKWMVQSEMTKWHCVETLGGAWSLLPAATNTKTAWPFPLCCKRHMLFFLPPTHLRNETRVSNDWMPKRNKKIIIRRIRVQIESLSQKTCNQNIHLCQSYFSDNLCLRPSTSSSLSYVTFRYSPVKARGIQDLQGFFFFSSVSTLHYSVNSSAGG